MKKAILCGHLFNPNSGKHEKDRLVLIENDIIVDVTAAGEVPEGFETVDLKGKYVLPGLIDAHVHCTASGEPNTFGEAVRQTAADLTLISLRNAQSDLRAGFTTLRDAGSSNFVDVALRNAITRGDVQGPRLKVCGLAIGSTGGHADTHYSPDIKVLSDHGMVIDGADQARKGARYCLKYGADFLKFMSTGGVLSFGTTVGAQQLTFDEISAIIEIAEMYGVHTATHAHGTAGIKAAVRAGVTSVEHGMILDDEAIELMLEKGTYLTPTIIAAERIVASGAEAGIPAWAVAKAKQVLGTHEAGVRKCLARGVKLTFGSDAGTPFNFHGKQGYEFELLCSFGLTAAQALTAATKTNSELLRMSDKIGSVEKGKYADVIAFDADPLADIKIMKHCAFVMKGGQIITA